MGNKYKTEGVELLIPSEVTDIKFRGQFPINFYEKQERRYLKQYLNPEATVLELGACLGVVSCVTNKLLTHPERHVVVEANPNLIQFIERNREHNGSGFQIEHCMVSDQKSNPFFIGRTILMSSNRRASSTQIEVPGKSIKALEQTHDLQFDTLVMDIEGGEREAILGARYTIRRFRPGLAISAYHLPADLWQLGLLISEIDENYQFYLRSHGYSSFDTVLYAVSK
jgi:FkbM family methyltransferase